MSLEKLNFIEKRDNLLKSRLLNQLNILPEEKLTALEINALLSKIDEMIEYLKTLKLDVSDYKGLVFEYVLSRKAFVLKNAKGEPLAVLDLNFILSDVVLNSDFNTREIPNWSEFLQNQLIF